MICKVMMALGLVVIPRYTLRNAHDPLRRYDDGDCFETATTKVMIMAVVVVVVVA